MVFKSLANELAVDQFVMFSYVADAATSIRALIIVFISSHPLTSVLSHIASSLILDLPSIKLSLLD